MKLEFNIGKPETDLKKIVSTSTSMTMRSKIWKNKEADHPSNDLTNDNNSNIEDHGTQLKRINQNNSLYTIVENKLQLSPQLDNQNETND